jgi:hypothetical protein
MKFKKEANGTFFFGKVKIAKKENRCSLPVIRTVDYK